MGHLSLIQWSLSKGQVGDGSFIPYTVEPLYKGQVGDGSFIPYTVEPLYKGQVGDGSFIPYTVEPLYKGQVFYPWFLSHRKVEVTNVPLALYHASPIPDIPGMLTSCCQSRLDVEPRPHVLGLLLHPDELSVGISTLLCNQVERRNLKECVYIHTCIHTVYVLVNLFYSEYRHFVH